MTRWREYRREPANDLRVFAAIGQWAAAYPATGPNGQGACRAPDESTFRRVFARVDADALSAAIGAWTWTATSVRDGRRVIALDGKTIRGARRREEVAPHLVGALDHATGTILGQFAVAAKSNEIPAVRTLLAGFDLTGTVVTVDAMHTQHDTARAIVDGGGDYVFTVKKNQPTLYGACKDLPWADVPARTSTQRGHGRRATRTIKVVDVPAWVTFTGAAQVAQIRRTEVPDSFRIRGPIESLVEGERLHEFEEGSIQPGVQGTAGFGVS